MAMGTIESRLNGAALRIMQRAKRNLAFILTALTVLVLCIILQGRTLTDDTLLQRHTVTDDRNDADADRIRKSKNVDGITRAAHKAHQTLNSIASALETSDASLQKTELKSQVQKALDAIEDLEKAGGDDDDIEPHSLVDTGKVIENKSVQK